MPENDQETRVSESDIKTVRVDPVEVRAAAEAMKADLEAKAKVDAEAKTIPVDPKVVRAAAMAMKEAEAPAPAPTPQFKGIFIPRPRNLHDD